VAFVSPADGVSLDTNSLQLFLRRKLADYKLPRRIVVMSELPRNASGKILKTALRELPTG
jgi:acyl-coenzyme A synthetase/AMP-(fatty) acid ligase